ncbi:hypothetical protein TorRG33x02_026830 [Trema orientale]|uniref:Uncharacterized protein n=1 Tax=Trema orientale TaxID=63057 RepID=A0A2P5FUA0_TREOI|nr:hypothetical protein TorRG33x02_026830 [Trema orientale]
MASESSSLWAELLYLKYYRNSSFAGARLPAAISTIAKTIWSMRELTGRNYVYLIANGESIDI